MTMSPRLISLALTLWAAPALAHVSVAGPGFAGKSQVLVFSVGHGCEGADTTGIRVSIPKEVVSVRALPSAFDHVEIEKNDEGAVVAVVWTKDDVRPADDHYYQFSIRIGVPDVPFSTIHFPTRQTCHTADGEEIVVDWAETSVGSGDGEDEPAPGLRVLPPRVAGWNEYSVVAEIKDLSVFDDAQIVWVGDAAYSPNPSIQAVIAKDTRIKPLETVPAGSKVWVKY